MSIIPESFSRYLSPAKNESWGSTSTGKYPSGVFAMHLTYPDTAYDDGVTDWQSGVNSNDWRQGLTVLIRTPLAASSSTIAEAKNVIAVDLKAAANANPTMNFDLGSENATRMIAAKINSRRIKMVGERDQARYVRAMYVRQSLPRAYSIIGATMGAGAAGNVNLEIATCSKHGFPSEFIDGDYILRVENASTSKNIDNGDYTDLSLRWLRSPEGGSYNALIQATFNTANINGSPTGGLGTTGDTLSNSFTLIGESPKHTIVLSWDLVAPSSSAHGYWGEQSGGPIIQGMGSIGVHRLVAKPMDGGNRGIPALNYATRNGKTSSVYAGGGRGFNRFSIEGLNSCNLPDMPPPDFHSIHPTIRGITTVHPNAETDAVSNNRLRIQPLEYATGFSVKGTASDQKIGFSTGYTTTDFTATTESAYVSSGANGVHIKNVDVTDAATYRTAVADNSNDTYAREFMTTMTENAERVVGLQISNEEKVFESIVTTDDLGNELILEGGSPFGTVIRDYKITNERENTVTGETFIGPSNPGGDVAPNLRIQLPKQEDIPGGIFVRAGHDRVQAWSNQTWGMGGLTAPNPRLAGVAEAANEASQYDTNDRSLIFHCQRILHPNAKDIHGLDTHTDAGLFSAGHTRLFAAHRASDHTERGSLLKQTNNGVETGNLIPHHRIRFGRQGHTFVTPLCHRGTPASLRRQLHRSHGSAYSLMFEAETEYKHHGFGNGNTTNTSSVFQLDTIDAKNTSVFYDTGSFVSDGLPFDELEGKRHIDADAKYTSATHRSIPDYLFAPGQTHTNVEGTPEFVSFALATRDGSISTGSPTRLELQGSTFTVRNRFNTASEVMINGFFINNYGAIGGRPEPIKLVAKDSTNNWFLRGYHEGVIRPRVATELATVPPLLVHDPEYMNLSRDDDQRDFGLIKASDTNKGGTPDAFLCHWLAEFSHPILFGTTREHYLTFRYRESGMPRAVNYPSTNGLFLRNFSNPTTDGQAEKALPFERLYIAQWLQNYGYNGLNAGGHGNVEGLKGFNCVMMGHTTLREARGTIQLYNQTGINRYSRGEAIGDSLNPTSRLRLVKGIDLDSDGQDLNKQFYVAEPYIGIDVSRRLPVRSWGIRSASTLSDILAGDPTENQNGNAILNSGRFDGGAHDSAAEIPFATNTEIVSDSTWPGIDMHPVERTAPVGFVASDFTTEAHPFERNIRQSNDPIKAQDKQIGIGANLGITQNGMLDPSAMAAGAWDYELNDNRPTTLPVSGPVLWLKADSLDLADGASINSWVDSSSNGFEFTQGTASAQPSLVRGDADYNGESHVHFDGNDSLSVPFSAKLNPNNMTIFVVATVDSDNNVFNGIIDNFTSNTGWLLYAKMVGSDNFWQWRTGTGSAQTTISASANTVVPNTPSIVTMKMAGSDGSGGGSTTQTLYVNGKSEATSSAKFTKKTNTSNTPVLGNVGSFALTGQMAEVIIFDRDLTDAEKHEVEAYLSRKYGVTISTSAPTSHTGRLHDVDNIPVNKGSDPFIDLVQRSGSPTYAQQDSAGAMITTSSSRFGHGSDFYHLRGNALHANFHAINETRGRFSYPPNSIMEAEMTSNVVSRVTPDLMSEISDVRQIQSRTEPRLGLIMEVESERNSNLDVNYAVAGTRAVSLHTDKMLGYQFPVLPSHVVKTFMTNSGFTVNGTGSAATRPDYSKKPTWSPDSNSSKPALLSGFTNDTVRSDFKTHALDAWAVRGVADLPAWGGVYILRKTYLNREEDSSILRTEVDGSTGKATPSNPVRKYVDYIIRPVRPLKLFAFASDLLQDGWTLGPRCAISLPGWDHQPFHRDKRYGIFELNESKGVNEVEPITSATSALTIEFPNANDYDVIYHLIPTANMLQHFKSDAHRIDNEGNFNPKIEARYSQASHPGGGEPVYQTETNFTVDNGVSGDHARRVKTGTLVQPSQAMRLYPNVKFTVNLGSSKFLVDEPYLLPASGKLIALDFKGRLEYTRSGDEITLTAQELYDQNDVAISDYIGMTFYFSDVTDVGAVSTWSIRTINDARSPVAIQAVSPSFVDNSVVSMKIQSQSWYHYDGVKDIVSKTALSYRGLMHYEPSDFVMVSQQTFKIFDGSDRGVIEHLNGKPDIFVDSKKLSSDYFPPYLIDSRNVRWRIADITQDQKNTLMVFKQMSGKSLSDSGLAIGEAIAGQFGYIGIRTTDAAMHLLNDAGGNKAGVTITPSNEFHNNSRDIESYLGAHPMLRQINDHSNKYIARDTRGLNTMEVLRNIAQLDGRQMMSENNGSILLTSDIFKERGLRIGSQNGADLIEVSRLFDSPNEIVIVGDVIAGNEIVFIRVQDSEKIREAATSGEETVVKTLRQQIPGIKSVSAARKLAKTLLSRSENGAPMITMKGLMNATSIMAGDIIDVNLPNHGVVGKFAVFEAKHKYQSLRTDLIIGQYEKGIEGLLSDIKTSTIDISGLSESAGDKDIKENITMSSKVNIISVHRVRVRNVNETGFIIGAKYKNGLGKIGVRDGNKRAFPIGNSKSRNYVVK